MRSDCYVWQDGQELSSQEFQSPVQSPVQKRSTEAPSAWQSLGYRLMSYFSGSTEPQIRQRTYGDRLIWHVYDPITQQQMQFSSEQEVRVWLDQRYSA